MVGGKVTALKNEIEQFCIAMASEIYKFMDDMVKLKISEDVVDLI